MINRSLRRLLPVALVLLLAACGGGGSGSDSAGPPPPPPPPPPPALVASYINLTSEVGDSIGGGEDYTYSNANARIAVTADGGRLTIEVEGDEWWTAVFQMPDTASALQPGSYIELQRYPFHDLAVGGLSWFGNGRGCNTLTGWMIIDSVAYDGATLTAIDLRFEQHCEGRAPALQGEIHWDARDTSGPVDPVVPPPAGLWKPAASVTPEDGNYLYLESEQGDVVGAGGQYLFTEATAVMTVKTAFGRLSVTSAGSEVWFGDLQAMNTLPRLEVGYYGDIQRRAFINPVMASMNWSGGGRSCDSLTGWFVVDSVTYDGENLAAIDLRFRQQCEDSPAALHGELHWIASDSIGPPGPIFPPPSGLWEPTEGVTPTTGNYIYLESEAGDYIGQGGAYLYTLADSLLTVSAGGAGLMVAVQGDEYWNAVFQGMNSISRLEVGYYGNLQLYPYHIDVVGGMTWYGDGRICGTMTGWFVVDDVTYVGATLTAIDLRFEQHCDGEGPALRGEIHWDANDTTRPPGPVVPPPAGLWQPAPGVTPASGNYVYVESEPGAHVGAGGTYLYTQAVSQLTVITRAERQSPDGENAIVLAVEVDGDEHWSGAFQAMLGLSRIEVGYYGDLHRWPFHNWAKGGMDWSGEGATCNDLSGWFVVDSVTYEGETLTAIDLRFEQRCEFAVPATRGKIHWDTNDTTGPAGPVVPPPAGLWEPAAGATPANGNYVYLVSESGDYIVGGGNYLYVPADGQINVSAVGRRLMVWVSADEEWSGEFQGMNTLSRLEVGYYGEIQRPPYVNPVTAGMRWSGEGRACNTVTGWFVVDNITYVGETLTAVDLRFEQHCEGRTPALYGEVHWRQ
jgi:hypothetical protein